jgi:heme/copper-type cytochrome/quinol oxidase subunit 2
MKRVPAIILIVALALTGYGYWGAFTDAGNKVYDEMDAYYPFFMLAGGVILFIIWLIIILVRRTKK